MIQILTAAIAITDWKFSELKRIYIRKSIIFSICIALFFAATVMVISRITFLFLRRLTGYAGRIASGKKTGAFKFGSIIEFNIIDNVMEHMVQNLKMMNIRLAESFRKSDLEMLEKTEAEISERWANHNGKMEVESEPGKGTRFILRLPLAFGESQ